MGSKRLKGKTLMTLANHTLLDTVINSVKRNAFIDDIVIVTSNLEEDDMIAFHCEKQGLRCVRGESEDVLSRFILVAKTMEASDIIVRVTADNPLNNTLATKALFKKHISEENDYTHVEGLSHVVYEFLNVATLLQLENLSDLNNNDKEHVTMYLRRKCENFRTGCIPPCELGLKPSLDTKLTVDSFDDYKRFQKMKLDINIDEEVNFNEVYRWLKKNMDN